MFTLRNGIDYIRVFMIKTLMFYYYTTKIHKLFMSLYDAVNTLY